jgi:hypothetical protein
MKPRPVFKSFASSGSPHTSRNRFAMTRQAVGDTLIANPLSLEKLGCRDGGAAAAESVQYVVVLVAAGLDDAVQQRNRLLWRISESFCIVCA